MNHRLFFVTLLSFSIISTFSCKKPGMVIGQSNFTNNGIITGSDLRKCICCGGLMITFNTNPLPYAAPFKLIENAEHLDIKPNDKFPLYVQIVWHTDTLKGCNNIIVDKMTRK